MRGFCRLICTIFIVLVISLCCLSPVASVENDTIRKKVEVLGQKISKVTANPRVRKYFSGALLGSAFAATLQPFKNAKDHFLVWDFKTVRQLSFALGHLYSSTSTPFKHTYISALIFHLSPS